MSRLQELIAEMCPDGVEYRALGDVGASQKGVRVVRKELSKGGLYPVYQNSLTPLGYYDRANRKAGTPFVIGAGAASQVGYSDVDWWAADDCFTFDIPVDEVNGRFVYYCLLNQQSYLKQRVRKASIPRLARTVVERIRIPVPPIEVQREVVRVLDEYVAAHDELVGWLEEEIAYRNEQMSLSREQAFANELWPKRPLGEVFETITGSTPKKGNASYFGDEHPFYKPGDLVHGLRVATTVDGLSDAGIGASRVVESGSILVTCIGATIGKTAMAETRGACNQQINAILPSDGYDMRFYLHFCCSEDFQKQIRDKGSFDNMPIISRGKFDKLLVPVPPREDQFRVADKLDCLAGVMSDYLDELENEIVLLKTQLAEVNNKLLSFPEKENR